jgi:hypothetical protein
MGWCLIPVLTSKASTHLLLLLIKGLVLAVVGRSWWLYIINWYGYNIFCSDPPTSYYCTILHTIFS